MLRRLLSRRALGPIIAVGVLAALWHIGSEIVEPVRLDLTRLAVGAVTSFGIHVFGVLIFGSIVIVVVTAYRRLRFGKARRRVMRLLKSQASQPSST